MPAKSSLRSQNKKLTDFFTQRPSASTPQSATSSSAAGTITSTTRRRPVTRATTVALDRELRTDPSAPSQLRSASMTGARKRPRSPSSNSPSTSSRPPPKPKSPRKPMNIFQPDPRTERATGVIYVTSPFRNSAPAPTPLQIPDDSSVGSPSSSRKQVVCSSQSDEVELVLSTSERRSLGNVTQGIYTWRQKTSEFSPSSPCAREDAMEVDPLSSSPVRGTPLASRSPQLDAPTCFERMHRSSSAFQTSFEASACLPSPPNSNEFPPLPPTPEPLDSEAKTAKLIAEIRARAFAATQSSDDERPLQFRELEDSDDGELDGDLPLIGNARRQRSWRPAPIGDIFSSPLSSVPSAFDDPIPSRRTRRTPDLPSPLRRTRTSARICKTTQAFRMPVTIAESTASKSVDRKSRALPQNRKKTQAMNPLQALLREKELQDKRGTGSAAVRLAEKAIEQASRGESADSDDELYSVDRSHLTDEQAAWKAVQDFQKSTSPPSLCDTDEFAVGDRESEMLGAVAGKAINKIFASDKDSKGKGKAQNASSETSPGVPLWIQSSDDDMETDSIPNLPFSGHPVLTCLEDSLRNRDDLLLGLILRDGALAVVPTDVLLSNIPQLLNMALLASSQTAEGVYIAFRDLWELGPQRVQIPFTAILSALVRLGASPSALERLGFITESARKNYVTHATLLEALKRLLAIIKTAAFVGAFSSGDVASVVLVLIVIGLDSSTARELRTQLIVALDDVCNSSATDDASLDIHEKVLGFARKLTPIDKDILISLFASGSGRARNIARHLAYYLLVATPETSNNQALPLEPLVLLLSPDAGSCELFDITDASTNYEELGHYINILSVALLDIAPYVEEERALMKSMQGSPNKSKKLPVPPLELLRKVLEVLQSKIVDTRAAHLDRSRTKAAIQRLTLRICYHRMALMGNRPCRRESTLKAYFSPQRS